MYKKIKLTGEQKIWFTSDAHYGHKNICRGVSNWWNNDLPEEDQRGTYAEFLAGTRDFPTVEKMNESLVDNINKYVGEDDWLVNLGDWSFGGEHNIWEFRKQIKCKNIVFILGNHDHHIANNKTLSNCFWNDTGKEEYIADEPEHTYGDFRDEFFKVSAQELFESVHSYLELTVVSPKGKVTYNLMHFPLAVWNKAHHNRIMLHGHCHANFQHEGRSLDVGVDKAYEIFGEHRPFSQEDINDFMDGREFVVLDHHNKNTN